ncbi:MMPL family transporter [Paenibacillus gansuensis]|uniref:MMPL family transporter n=1 Tax=Paenibacillus gansuensis TaxID=306542 RepID=A0ABW5PI26_9BACL
MLERLAKVSSRYPLVLLSLWIIFLLASGLQAWKLPSVLQDHGLRTQGEHSEVMRIAASKFGLPAEEPVIVLFQKKTGVSEMAFRQVIQSSLQKISSIQGWISTVSPIEHKEMRKGAYAYALLDFKQDSTQISEIIGELKAALPRTASVTAELTGKKIVQTDVNTASRKDLASAEWIGIPAAFLILWLSFGGLASAGIPVLMGVISVTGAMGIMAAAGAHLTLSVFVLNVIPMVGLALSIDFALLIVSRFREELRLRPPAQALRIAMRTSGRAIVVSASCMGAGLIGISAIELPIFRSVALGALVVLCLSVLLTLTLLPALLFLLRNRFYREAQKKRAIPHSAAIWRKLANLVLHRPIASSIMAAAALILCIQPLSTMKLSIPDETSIPDSYVSRSAAARFQEEFNPEHWTTLYLVAEPKKSTILSSLEKRQLQRLTDKLKADPMIAEVMPIRTKPASGQKAKEKRTLFQLTLMAEGSSIEARQWASHFQQQYGAQMTGLHMMLGGEAKYQQEVFDTAYRSFGKAAVFILTVNFALLMLAFRSVLIPLKTLLLNALCLAASFGIMAYAVSYPNVDPQEGIAIMIPIFIIGLVFGISMDYGVFLLSRIRESYLQTGNHEAAIAEGVGSTGGMIGSAAAIMIAVTLPFAFGEVAGVRQLGAGIASAVFIDATLIRMMLVPSLMKLFGRWNWWAPGV